MPGRRNSSHLQFSTSCLYSKLAPDPQRCDCTQEGVDQVADGPHGPEEELWQLVFSAGPLRLAAYFHWAPVGGGGIAVRPCYPSDPIDPWRAPLPEQVQEPEPSVRDPLVVQVCRDQGSILLGHLEGREGRTEGQQQQPGHAHTDRGRCLMVVAVSTRVSSVDLFVDQLFFCWIICFHCVIVDTI